VIAASTFHEARRAHPEIEFEFEIAPEVEARLAEVCACLPTEDARSRFATAAAETMNKLGDGIPLLPTASRIAELSARVHEERSSTPARFHLAPVAGPSPDQAPAL
jgi:hypothetical protein